MRKLLAATALALLALFPGCGCEKGSSSSSSSFTPEAPKLPPPVRVGPEGATIERGKAKLEVPKGAFGAEQDVRFDEVRGGTPSSYKPAGNAFSFSAGQATFAAPLKVTLPIDASRIPAGTKPAHVYAVLAYHGMGEVLPTMNVDLDAATVTILLDHAFPFCSGDAAGSGAGPVLQAAVNPGGIDTLDVSPKYVWCAAHGLDRAETMVEKGKAIMRIVHEAYRELGMADLGQVTFTFKPMNPAWGGVTTGSNSIEINSDKFLGYDERTQGEIFMHEYFHMLQLRTIARNVAGLKAPLPGDYWQRGKTEWLKEATATWMQENVSGPGASKNTVRLKPDFCYLPLNAYQDSTEASPHQYAAYIFFAWLDTMYSGRQIIVRTYREIFTGQWLKMAGLEQDAGQGRGTFNPLDLLDHILQDTPDNQGRKRTLRELYAEFLLHFAWLKDIPTMKGDPLVRSALGAPGEVMVVTDKATSWTLPDGSGASRVTKRSETVAGEGFHIVRVFVVKRGENAGGDLEVSLKTAARWDPRESMLVVFPMQPKAGDPSIGTAAAPVRLRNWSALEGALVWVVDLSVTGQPDLTVTAEVKTGDEMSFELRATPPREPYTDPMAQLNLEIAFVPPAGVDASTDEGKKKFREVADRWFKQLEKERGDAYQWVHAIATVDGRAQHSWAHVGNTNPPLVSIFGGKLLLPRKPGTYQVDVKATFRGQKLSASYPVTVQLPGYRQPATDDLIRRKLGDLEHLREIKAEPYRFASEYLSLGNYYADIWKDDDALDAWRKGLEFVIRDAERGPFVEAMALLAYQRGDMDSYLSAMEVLKKPVSYEDVAVWVLALEGNPRKAKALRARVPGIKEEELERFRMWPNEGDEVE